jgi:O-antigen ligase
VESGAVGLFLFLGILVFQLKGAYALPLNAKQSLLTVTAIAAVMGLMNCPYFGAGMGECLVYLAASLLTLREIQPPLPDRS